MREGNVFNSDVEAGVKGLEKNSNARRPLPSLQDQENEEEWSKLRRPTRIVIAPCSFGFVTMKQFESYRTWQRGKPFFAKEERSITGRWHDPSPLHVRHRKNLSKHSSTSEQVPSKRAFFFAGTKTAILCRFF